MSAEQIDPETGEIQDVPARSVGLDFRNIDELRNFLWREHRVTVGADDPILLVHSILRVFLTEIDQRLSDHDQTLGDRVNGAAKSYSDGIRETVDAFREKALTAGLDRRLDVMTEQVRLSEGLFNSMKSLKTSWIVLSVVNWGATLLTLAILFTVSR